MARTFLSFEQRLAKIPQDRHVTYSLKVMSGTSKPAWYAQWKENGRTTYVYLGQDQDGIIAARAKEQRSYEKGHEKVNQHELLQKAGTCMMRDPDRVEYLVDLDMVEFVIRNDVWTDKQTGLLMIRYRIHLGSTATATPLHVFIYRTMTEHDTPPNPELRFKDANPRNCTYRNIERVYKQKSA